MEISIQSASIIREYGCELGAKMIHDAGFTALDWNIDTALSRDALKSAAELKDLCIFEKPLPEVLAYFDEQLSAFKKYGLTVTQAHAPFPAYFPDREDILDYCIEIYKRCIELCDAVGCKNLVIHGITVYETDTNVEKGAYYKELNWKLYRSLIDTVKKTNVTVCLENLFKSCGRGFYAGMCADPHEAVEFIDTLNREAGKECFGFCLDTGHIHLLRTRFFQYVPVLGDRIKALHVHDNQEISDAHLMPYAGTIDWNDFLDAMHAIGYNGDLSFETFAQTRKNKIPSELLPTFLSTIHAIGVYFREKISET